MFGFFHHRGDVQQRLGRNAADVEADAAERRVALDDDRLHAEVGGAEGGRVAAGAGAEDEHFAFEVGTAGMAGGHRCRGRRRGCCGRRRSRGRCGAGDRGGRSGGTGFDLDQHGAFADLGAELDLHFLDHAFDRARHVHGRLVGFERGDGVFDLDACRRP